MKLLNLRGINWSGRMDLNHRPPGPEPGALARLRYAPTDRPRRSIDNLSQTQNSTAPGIATSWPAREEARL